MSQIQIRDKRGNPIRGINVRYAIGSNDSDSAPDDKPSDYAGNLAFPTPIGSPNGYSLYINERNVNSKYKAQSPQTNPELRVNSLTASDIPIVLEYADPTRIVRNGDKLVYASDLTREFKWCFGSNFMLAQMLAEGVDIKPLLYPGLNGYRLTGTYVNIAVQKGLKAFNPTNYPNWLNHIADTFDILFSEGKWAQLNLFCDMQMQGYNLGQMRDMHRSVTDMLKTKPNSFYSLGNENQNNGFNADDFDKPAKDDELVSACGSGLTGGPAPTSRGGAWTIQHQHLRRDIKMFIDIPPVDAPTYNMNHIVIFDETIGYADFDSGSRSSNVDWAGKMGRIMSAFNGGVIHLNRGVHSETLSPREQECCDAFSGAMEA